MFEFPDITKGMPTMRDHLNTVVAAVLAGAMLQKADVPAGEEELYLLKTYRHFRETL
jgi:hypothetical protein